MVSFPPRSDIKQPICFNTSSSSLLSDRTARGLHRAKVGLGAGAPDSCAQRGVLAPAAARAQRGDARGRRVEHTGSAESLSVTLP